MGEAPELVRVTNDAVVVPVALQLAPEGGHEIGKPTAPVLLEPVLELGKPRTELLRVGGASHPPIVGIASALSPEEVETKESELSAAFSLPPVELDQRALLFSEFESEFREAHGQCPQIRLGIVLSFEADDTVVGERCP